MSEDQPEIDLPTATEGALPTTHAATGIDREGILATSTP